MRRQFPTEDGFSIAIREVRFSGPGQATAQASMVLRDANGHRSRYPNTSFQLVRRAGRWRVLFIS
jgi:hypothetical protein